MSKKNCPSRAKHVPLKKRLEPFFFERIGIHAYAVFGIKDYHPTSIDIPDGVSVIKDNAFNDGFNLYKELTSIFIPKTVTSIGHNAFKNCCSALTSIIVGEGNPVYHSVNNCLIETESKILILGCQSSVIPDDGSVTKFGPSAFEGCSALTSITIPNSVISIGNHAFHTCKALTSITIPERFKKDISGIGIEIAQTDVIYV